MFAGFSHNSHSYKNKIEPFFYIYFVSLSLRIHILQTQVNRYVVFLCILCIVNSYILSMLTLTLSAIFALYKCMLLFIITMFQFDVVVFCFFRLERVFLCNIFEERKKSNFVALTFHRREPKKEKKKHRKRDNAFAIPNRCFCFRNFFDG